MDFIIKKSEVLMAIKGPYGLVITTITLSTIVVVIHLSWVLFPSQCSNNGHYNNLLQYHNSALL